MPDARHPCLDKLDRCRKADARRTANIRMLLLSSGKGLRFGVSVMSGSLRKDTPENSNTVAYDLQHRRCVTRCEYQYRVPSVVAE